MVVHGYARYACWPWYDCGCPVGKLVSESVMRRHLKAANEKRAELGRGAFKSGPKVTDPCVTEYQFRFIESLEDHESDDEGEVTPHTLLEDLMDAPQSISSYSAPNAFESTQILEENYFDAANSSSMEQNLAIAEVDLHDEGPLIYPEPHYHLDSHNAEVQDPTIPGSAANDHSLSECEPAPFQSAHSDGQIAIDVSPSLDVNSDRDVANHDSILGDDVEQGTNPTADPMEFSRIPQLLTWVFEHRKWVDLYLKHGLEFTVMDDILAMVGAPCKKWITVMNCISRANPIMESLVTIPNCPGHMCFANLEGLDPVSSCKECGRVGPLPDSAYYDFVYYLPILPRIAAIVSTEQGYNSLYGYRSSYATDAGVGHDYFDSQAFQKLCEEHGGEENLRYDIFLSVSTDGFQAYKNKAYDVWPVAAIFYNLLPQQRTCVKNVIPLMFIPDGKEPKDLQSYLVPLVNEILGITASGEAVLQFLDGREHRVRLHLIHFTGDGPAVAKVASLKGHHGKCHCRFCLAKGVYSSSARGYYFPSQYNTESGEVKVMYSPEALPLRTEASTSNALLQLENALTLTEREFISRETGIKGPSVLLQLPSMVPYTSFPIDTMHLFYNLQVRLLELLTSVEQDEYTLSTVSIDRLDDELRKWGLHISGQICPRPKPLSQFRRWKAEDHRIFTLQYCLVLFDGYLPKEYLDGLRHFVQLVDICTRISVTEYEIESCGKHALEIFRHYEESYMRYDQERINMSKSVFHQILHLKECLPESMARNAFFRESCKAFFEEPFQYSAEHYDHLQEGDDIEFLSPSGVCNICEEDDGGRKTRRLLADYLKRKYSLSPSESRTLAQHVDTFQSFSRSRFCCGNGTQVAKVYRGISLVDGSKRAVRESSYIAVEMDCDGESADVYYGRLARLLKFELQKLEEEEDGSPWHAKHEVAVIEWVSGICLGEQGQTYKSGSASQCFTSSTMEDAVIISRLIGVVEHTLPRQTIHTTTSQHSRSTQMNGRVRTYFLDQRTRSDYLLDEETRSVDGVNRVLKGLRASH